MEKVYEHEVRTTTFASPSRDAPQRERVSEVRREVRASRSPISGSKRLVEERFTEGSGRKTTTIVYEGPHGVTTTTVYKREDDLAPTRTPTRVTQYERVERPERVDGYEPGRTAVYGSTVSQSSAHSVYDKYSPSRTKQFSGTKVVYDGDPAHPEVKAETVTSRRQQERTFDNDLETQVKPRSIRRTTIERSPGKRVERTVEYVDDQDSREPERNSYTRVRESPKVSTVERTITESPAERRYERTYERTEVVRDERRPSPSKTSVTRITRDSPYSKRTTEITRTVDEVEPERTVYTRTVREASPNRYEVTHKTVRDSPLGKSEIVTRTIREEDPEERRPSYVKRSVVDRQIVEPAEEPQHSSSYTRTVITRRGDDLDTYSRTEVTPAHTAEDYPRRVRPADADNDVVVLKYTSPYKNNGSAGKPRDDEVREKVTRRVYETTSYY